MEGSRQLALRGSQLALRGSRLGGHGRSGSLACSPAPLDLASRAAAQDRQVKHPQNEAQHVRDHGVGHRLTPRPPLIAPAPPPVPAIVLRRASPPPPPAAPTPA